MIYFVMWGWSLSPHDRLSAPEARPPAGAPTMRFVHRGVAERSGAFGVAASDGDGGSGEAKPPGQGCRAS